MLVPVSAVVANWFERQRGLAKDVVFNGYMRVFAQASLGNNPGTASSYFLNTGQVLSVDELLNRVWGKEYMGESQVVYVHIHWLREHLEEDPQNPRRIVTVRGVGYKLEAVEG